jgi:hypothetical protein
MVTIHGLISVCEQQLRARSRPGYWREYIGSLNARSEAVVSETSGEAKHEEEYYDPTFFSDDDVDYSYYDRVTCIKFPEV